MSQVFRSHVLEALIEEEEQLHPATSHFLLNMLVERKTTTRVMKRQRHFPSVPPGEGGDAPARHMSAKRQKIDRVSTAAFAASQPLFDSLRNARERLPDQGMHLTMAANLVQQLHVGLKIEDGKNDIGRHAKYMDAIVEAWRCATDTYCDVFSQLAAITAEKPEEGRSAAAAHPEFVKMLESARRAQKVVKEYTWAREELDLPILPAKATVNMKAASSDADAAEPPSSSMFPPSQATPTPAAKKSKPRAKPDQSNQPGRVDHKKKKTSEMAPGKQTNGVEQATNGIKEKPSTADVPAEVNDEATTALKAEVDARIKAKEEARLAKKAAKKRKRESGDSFVAADDAPNVDSAVLSERPKKKKAKKSNHNSQQQATETAAAAAASVKRKGSVDQGAGNGDKPTKKQKKNKNKG